MKHFRLLVIATLLATVSCASAGTSPSKPMETLSASSLRFLAEQNGSFESTVKAKIAAVLPAHQEIQRAYLVSVLYPDSTTGVVLGLVSSQSPSPAILSDIQDVFAATAPSNLSLDILFLNAQQQKQVAAVAKPFYVGP